MRGWWGRGCRGDATWSADGRWWEMRGRQPGCVDAVRFGSGGFFERLLVGRVRGGVALVRSAGWRRAVGLPWGRGGSGTCCDVPGWWWK